jgi:hypothetical protein
MPADFGADVTDMRAVQLKALFRAILCTDPPSRDST